MNAKQPQPPVPPQHAQASAQATPGENPAPTSRRPSFADTYRSVQAARRGEGPAEEEKVERPVTAFVVVDAQNDFSEGGSLAVAGAVDAYRATYRHLAGRAGKYSVLATTRDNHIDPGDHWSDNPDYTDTWPRHCAAGEPGSDFHPEMKRALDYFAQVNPQVPRIDVTKGEYEAAYSGFEGKTADGTPLADALRAAEVERLEVVGVATDHCVRATVLDGLREGFDVAVYVNQTAAVDGERGAAALKEMAAAGAEIHEK